MTHGGEERPILSVEGLSVWFETPLGLVQAADDVTFDLLYGETLALVGETGCGKSVVASSIMRLLPRNAVVEGRVIYSGMDLLCLEEKEISRIRGREISMIFQNPSLALNPIIPVADQIAEPPLVHRVLHRRQAMEAASLVMRRLGLGGLAERYPFQFSGGMNQRAMIASSLILSPRVIIADEPSKGLDESLSSEVVGEISREKQLHGSSLLLITHDISLARRLGDRIAVMYCGQVLEIGGCREVLEEPRHPYTAALLECLPERGFRPIPGSSPSMISPPAGCRYRPRCPVRGRECAERPVLVGLGGEGDSRRMVRCWRF